MGIGGGERKRIYSFPSIVQSKQATSRSIEYHMQSQQVGMAGEVRSFHKVYVGGLHTGHNILLRVN